MAVRRLTAYGCRMVKAALSAVTNTDGANLAAACDYCNRHGHAARAPLSTEQHRARVRDSLRRCKWHRLMLTPTMLAALPVHPEA